MEELGCSHHYRYEPEPPGMIARTDLQGPVAQQEATVSPVSPTLTVNRLRRWSKKPWSRALLVLVAIVIFVSIRAYMLMDPKEARIAAEFSTLSSGYGITIDATLDADFFPDSWKLPPISARAVAISEGELHRFPNILKIALAQYPIEVIRDNLKTVCLAQDIYFYDTPYGATNSTDTVYLTSEGWTQGYTDQYLVETFHDEFSSILMRNYPLHLQHTRWVACNPPGFKYRNNNADDAGREAITQHRDKLDGDPKLYKDGFLSEYSMANLEEDVNTFSGHILTRPQEMRSLIRQYPRLKMKYRVWLDFYHSVNPKMTESFLLGNHK
jgi:hypothetical protein